MKKPHILTLIGLCLGGFIIIFLWTDKKTTPTTNYQSDSTSTTTVPQANESGFLIEDTATYLTHLSKVITLQSFMNDLRKEVPDYLKYIKYLNKDSVKAMSIDFIGVVHVGISDMPMSKITSCQAQVYNMIKDYDYVGSEECAGFGVVSKTDYLKEQQARVSLLVGQSINFEKVKDLCEKNPQNDAVVKILMSYQNPKVFATEPNTLYLMQLKLLGTKYDTHETYKTLLDLRSEIAVAKTIAFIRKNHLENKKVVIVYGKDHVDMFIKIINKLGIKSMYGRPPECE